MFHVKHRIFLLHNTLIYGNILPMIINHALL